jgi:hypothetical protein
VLTIAYLTGLPLKFLRTVAGFDARGGEYFLGRAAESPPQQLQLLIWPWIEAWEARFRRRAGHNNWAAGGLDNTDTAEQGFLQLLRHLRIVLLQDLAVLQPQYLELPLFRHPVFQHPEWAPFAHSVRICAAADVPQSLLLRRAVPEVANAVQNSRDAVLQQGAKHHESLDSQMKGLTATVNALATGRIQFQMTGVGGFGSTACCPSCGAQKAEQHAATVERASLKSIPFYCFRANSYVYL